MHVQQKLLDKLLYRNTFISQSKDINIPFIQWFLPFDIIKRDNRKYKLVCVCVIIKLLKIYLFMSFRTSRDIMGRFLTILNANIGL